MSSKQCQAFQELHYDLVIGIKYSVSSIADRCLAKALITSDTYDAILEQDKVAAEKTRKLLSDVKKSITEDAKNFDIFRIILENESCANLSKKLQAKYKELSGDHPPLNAPAHSSGSVNGASPGQAQQKLRTVLEKQIDQKRMRILKWRDVNGQEQIVRIMDDIANKWKAIGEMVGIGGPKLLGWEREYQNNAEDCLHQVIMTWLQSGSDEYPATWNGLISLLKDLKLNDTASQIEAAAGDPNSQLYK